MQQSQDLTPPIQVYVRLKDADLAQTESVEINPSVHRTVSDLKGCIVGTGLFRNRGLRCKGDIESVSFKGKVLDPHTSLWELSQEAGGETYLSLSTSSFADPFVITLLSTAVPQQNEWIGEYVLLKTHTDTYISASQDGNVSAINTRPQEPETWIMRTYKASGRVSFESFWGKCLCAESNGTVVANRDWAQAWELFTPIRVGWSNNGCERLAFKTDHNTFLCAELSGAVVANRTEARKWEEFELQRLVSLEECPKFEDVSKPICRLPLPSPLEELVAYLSLSQYWHILEKEEINDLRTVELLGMKGLMRIGIPSGIAARLVDAVKSVSSLPSYDLTKCVVTTDKGEMNAEDIAKELVYGRGWVVLPSFFSAGMAAQARRLLMSQVMLTNKDGKWRSRAEKGARQRRIHEIFALGEVFDRIATIPIVLDVCKLLLGEDFYLGSFDGHVLLPQCPRGGEHQDYPYWSKSESERLGILKLGDKIATYLFEVQTIIAVDDFTLQNGATWMLEGSQRSTQDYWTGKPDDFLERAIQLPCPAGSVIIGNGRVYHSSGANHSGRARAALLGQYLRNGVARMSPALDEEYSSPYIQKTSAILQLLCGRNRQPVSNDISGEEKKETIY